MNKTKIEWTDYTWNPVTGCTKVSQGCKFCYAETLFTRFGKQFGHEFTEVWVHGERLDEPVNMKKKIKGKKVFVCDMSDLFHERVPDDFIYDVFITIHKCPETTFQILTKRPVKAQRILRNLADAGLFEVPLPNVWLGVSVENKATADERIPLLLQIPAAVRFLSCEPLLGPIDLSAYLSPAGGGKGVDWVITGGESGPRPMHPNWVRNLRDQCASANVPFFFKQWGGWLPMDHLDEDQYWQSKKSMEVGTGYTSNTMFKVGKAKSGNLLDGKQHLEFPRLNQKPLI